MNKITTWLKENKYKSEDRIYTKPKDYYLNIINSKPEYLSMSKKTKDNIAYSLVYLEYLQIQLDELVLIDTIKKLIYKNYIVTSMSIIEDLLKKLSDESDNQRLVQIIKSYKKINPLNLSEKELESLDSFRKLRNHTHLLQKEDDKQITDWFKFTEKEFIEMKSLLNLILPGAVE